MTNTHPEENQFQNQILNQIMPSDDNQFMEIDDVVDNLVNAGIITASNFNVNVELFRGSPITVSIVKTGNPATEVPTKVVTEDSIEGQIEVDVKPEGIK
ncbi:hypothetical protein A6283_11580 [Bacillus wiedmannii]|uniref:Uncharacterized protein n=2 Tax=Bacillus cereus group TaxID=86661 RepID=A0A1D3P3V5_9BACI|nr:MULTISPECIES: hypothetical protein [Bacillus]EJQ54305.1 hypothetical protein IEI_01514 [Bacillus wiedmannii]KAA0775945.1 hypothetical protein DN392_13485 [Bacillus sp. BB51/4]KMP28982.1 hypothetical protein TU50_07150 [Bacillus wiedmannii]KXY06864.1 hypothetical protein AT260_19030 [Bacillus wiedmannii]MBJ8081639.1 hypothetical protein [Bacillus cereus group sp. N14]